MSPNRSSLFILITISVQRSDRRDDVVDNWQLSVAVNSPVISLHYSAIKRPLFSPTALELRFSSGMRGWPLILLLKLYLQAYKNKDKLFSFLTQNGFVLLHWYFIKNQKICQLLRSLNKKPWWIFMPFFLHLLIFHLCHINILH